MDDDGRKLIQNLDKLIVRRAMHYTCRAPLFGRAHRHADEFHLSYVVLGRCRIEVGGERFEVAEGDMVFIPPRLVHSSLGDSRTDYELIEIKFSAVRRRWEAVVPCLPRVLHVHNTGELVAALDRLVSAHLIDVSRGNRLAQLRLGEILTLLEKETVPGAAVGSSAHAVDWKIRQAAEYIALRYAHAVAVEDLAELVGMSGSHFAATFKRVMGVSPIELLIRTRLHHAKELLRSPTLSVKQVASVCGFRSAPYFARVFGRREGLSPSAYRRRASGR